MGFHLLSCVKDEGPFLLEWIAHHKVVGFDRILIAYNDCTDGTDLLLRELAKFGEIDIHENVVPEGKSPQFFAYETVKDSPFVQDAEWLAIFDSDEFINIHVGDGQLSGLLEKVDEADFLALNWVCFGDAGLESWEEGMITPRFKLAVEKHHVLNRGVKSITHKPIQFERFRNHHPEKFSLDRELKIANGNGEIVTHNLKTDGSIGSNYRHLAKGRSAYGLAQVNHYNVKTIDSFCLRVARGIGYLPDQGRHSMEYFVEHSMAATELDTSILRYETRSQNQIDRLLSLGNVKDIYHDIISEYQRRIALVQKRLNDGEFEMENYADTSFLA